MEIAMRARVAESWVVFRRVMKGQATEINVVCEVGEWEAMQAAHPDSITLIRYGIASEGEAERLARGKSGDPPAPRNAMRPVPSLLAP
jgi:hypothetical protein